MLNGHSIILALALLLAACGRDDQAPEPTSPTAAVQDRFAAEVARFTSRHVMQSYVVTRKAGTDEPEHQGEAILWSGVAMAHLPCADAAPIADGIARHILARGGRVNRMEPLPADYAGRRLNFDGETGLEYGMAVYAATCPAADRALMAEAWQSHVDAIAEDGGDLGAGEAMPLPFRFTGKALSFALGLGEKPGTAELRAMETAAAGWAWGLHAGKAACYRAHLGFRHLAAAEAQGYDVSWQTPLGFCDATRGMDIPNIDARCGRGDLAAWVDSADAGRWEMRFQRCGSWEDPDADGDEVPRLDVIEALQVGYGLAK